MSSLNQPRALLKPFNSIETYLHVSQSQRLSLVLQSRWLESCQYHNKQTNIQIDSQTDTDTQENLSQSYTPFLLTEHIIKQTLVTLIRSFPVMFCVVCLGQMTALHAVRVLCKCDSHKAGPSKQTPKERCKRNEEKEIEEPPIIELTLKHWTGSRAFTNVNRMAVLITIKQLVKGPCKTHVIVSAVLGVVSC